MSKAFPLILLVSVLVLSTGCEQLAPDQEDRAEMMQPLTDIPAAYGELEAVTVMPEYPGWFQLWFEDSAGTIREVRVHPAQGVMHREIKIITRSGPPPAVEEEN